MRVSKEFQEARRAHITSLIKSYSEFVEGGAVLKDRLSWIHAHVFGSETLDYIKTQPKNLFSLISSIFIAETGAECEKENKRYKKPAGHSGNPTVLGTLLHNEVDTNDSFINQLAEKFPHDVIKVLGYLSKNFSASEAKDMLEWFVEDGYLPILHRRDRIDVQKESLVFIKQLLRQVDTRDAYNLFAAVLRVPVLNAVVTKHLSADHDLEGVLLAITPSDYNPDAAVSCFEQFIMFQVGKRTQNPALVLAFNTAVKGRRVDIRIQSRIFSGTMDDLNRLIDGDTRSDTKISNALIDISAKVGHYAAELRASRR